MSKLNQILIIIVLGISVFMIQMTFAYKIDLLFKISLSLILLLVSIVMYIKINTNRIWILFYPYFIASASLLFSDLVGNWALLLFNLDTSSYVGQAVAKFSESLPIILMILFLIKLAGIKYISVYLTSGNLKSGLVIGVSFFLGFTLISIFFGASNPLFLDKLNSIELFSILKVIPWALLFTFTNGFMEELLFRGLFLKIFTSRIGFKLSNILTAFLFAIAHVQVTYVTNMIVFLIVVFILGLFLGNVMRKTNSIIAPMLIHAGADMMMILPNFINLM